MQTKRELVSVVDAAGKPHQLVKVTRFERRETLDGDDWMELQAVYETTAGVSAQKQPDGSFLVARTGMRYWAA